MPSVATPPLASGTAFEDEVARLVVTVLNLDVAADAIDRDAPLFNEGLGLDSIDMLEIALAVSHEYGCALRADDPDNVRTFSSLRSLAGYIAGHRGK